MIAQFSAPVPLRRLAALCAIALWAAAPAGATAPPGEVTVSDADARIVLGGAMRHLVDPTGALTLSDVLSPDRAGDWTAIEGDTPNFGYGSDAHWLAVSLRSRAAGRHDYLVEVQYPLLDEIVFHERRDGETVRVVHTGDGRTFDKRPIEHTTFVFPLVLEAGERCDLLLKVSTSSAVQVPVVLWTSEAFLARVNHLYTINGVFYGVMISILLYGLSLFVALRERNYLYFAGYIGSFTVLMLALDGMGYQYVWSALPFVQEHVIAVCLALTTATALLFADNFLHLREASTVKHRLLKAMGLASAAAALAAWVLPYGLIVKPVLLGAVGSTFVVLGIAARLWRAGSRPAFLFCLAWIAFLAGTCLMIFAKLGLIPPTLLTENGPTLGMLAQAALMITAMAEDLKATRRGKREATEELLKVQEASSRKLRDEVQRQTAQVQEMMRELARVNEELEADKMLDGLTGIFNRRAFDERLEMEYGRAERTGSGLAVLMVDIDHFKNFNDTYGHQTGDDCLRRVAETIEEESRRTTDFAARYGGEEFVVILAETPPEAAVVVGERIRAAVEAMEFEVDGVRVPVTVSVGAGGLVPADCEQDCEEVVVAMADAALYEAKRGGRNRVELSTEIPEGEPV